MNKVILLIVFYSSLMIFSGCERNNTEKTVQATDSNVAWDGKTPTENPMPDFFEGQSAGGAFPESMVGVWKSAIPNFDWTIEFDHNGSIKGLTHSLAGPINFEKGVSEGKGPDEGTYYLFVMGPCEARYISMTRMIKVKIVVDYYIMKLPTGEIEGRIEDYFEGPVSEDGKTWNAKWWNFGWLKDATVPDFNWIRDNPLPFVFARPDKEDVNN